MQKLNLVGAGFVGQSLAASLVKSGLYEAGIVGSRSLSSAEKAARFIAGGEPRLLGGPFESAGLWIIAVPDDATSEVVRALSEHDFKGAIVCHCSGALSSSVLKPLRNASVASTHPVKSFIEPTLDFAGTPVAIEGDDRAVKTLIEVFERIEAVPFVISTEAKLLYHAGMVFLCNYLTALFEGGYRLLEAGGVSREVAPELVRKIVTETLSNVLRHGPAAALTGPIRRGDVQLIQAQRNAISDPLLRSVYTVLGQLTISLADQTDLLTPEQILQLQAALREPS